MRLLWYVSSSLLEFSHHQWLLSFSRLSPMLLPEGDMFYISLILVSLEFIYLLGLSVYFLHLQNLLERFLIISRFFLWTLSWK